VYVQCHCGVADFNATDSVSLIFFSFHLFLVTSKLNPNPSSPPKKKTMAAAPPSVAKNERAARAYYAAVIHGKESKRPCSTDGPRSTRRLHDGGTSLCTCGCKRANAWAEGDVAVNAQSGAAFFPLPPVMMTCALPYLNAGIPWLLQKS
jgi:hypothetical protein